MPNSVRENRLAKSRLVTATAPVRRDSYNRQHSAVVNNCFSTRMQLSRDGKVVPNCLLVGVDKIKATVDAPHMDSISGRPNHPNQSPYTYPYFWTKLFRGRVGIKSRGRKKLVIDFNPSQLEYGHNVFRFTDPLYLPIREVFYRVHRQLIPFQDPYWDAKHWIMLRAGYVDLSELHLRADYRFPDASSLSQFMRVLKRSWTWRWNQESNNRFLTSLYIDQRNWSALFYFKGDEVEANHANWPPAVKALCRNRLRLEIKIRRQELRTLGHRLASSFTDFPELDLCRAED